MKEKDSDLIWEAYATPRDWPKDTKGMLNYYIDDIVKRHERIDEYDRDTAIEMAIERFEQMDFQERWQLFQMKQPTVEKDIIKTFENNILQQMKDKERVGAFSDSQPEGVWRSAKEDITQYLQKMMGSDPDRGRGEPGGQSKSDPEFLEYIRRMKDEG